MTISRAKLFPFRVRYTKFSYQSAVYEFMTGTSCNYDYDDEPQAKVLVLLRSVAHQTDSVLISDSLSMRQSLLILLRQSFDIGIYDVAVINL